MDDNLSSKETTDVSKPSNAYSKDEDALHSLQQCLLEQAKTIEELESKVKRAERDKESAVVKYASKEAEIIKLSFKLDDQTKAISKLKVENDKLKSALNAVSHETNSSGKHTEDIDAELIAQKWKEEAYLKDAMYTRCQAKLLAEEHAHEITRTKLEATIDDMRSVRQEVEITRQQCARFIEQAKVDEANRYENDQTKSANIIIESSLNMELASLREQLKTEMQRKKLVDQKLENTVNSLTSSRSTISDLESKIESLEHLITEKKSVEEELETVKRDSSGNQERVRILTSQVGELKHRLSACQIRERQSTLSFGKLADTVVELRSELASLCNRDNDSILLCDSLQNEVNSMNSKLQTLEAELEVEQQLRLTDNMCLTKRLADSEAFSFKLKSDLCNALEEAAVAKRKQHITSRQLAHLTKKNIKVSQTRVSDTNPHGLINYSHDLLETQKSLPNLPCSESIHIPNHLSVEVDSDSKMFQRLSDKIVKLHQQLVKTEDRLECAENDVHNLTNNLSVKSRIIEHLLLLRYESTHGRFAHKTDQARCSSQGFLSSMLQQIKSFDESAMTLDVAADINQKLQAVLEDTLMKNIALKESLDVLTNLVKSSNND